MMILIWNLAPSRTKQGGGHGGHNGLRDIDAKVGKDYHRLRVGVGHPGHKDLVSGYVLSNLPAEDLDGWVLDFLGDIETQLKDIIKEI